MTSEEHEIAALTASLIAHEVLLGWFADLCFAMIKLSDEEGQAQWRSALAFKLNEKREEYMGIVLKDRHPAESDLTAGLFQEAFLEAANKVLTREGLAPML